MTLHERNLPVEQISAPALAALVQDANSKLRGKVVRTATVPLRWLGREDDDASLGRQPPLEVYAKLEGHQHTGSFKYRGALYATMNTPAKAVVTASAGNHALALCAAAKALGKSSHVIVPIGVSEIKARRILDEADTVSFIGNDLYSATDAALRRVAGPNLAGEEYTSPYAAVDVAAGAGTMVIEA
jgi:threonine dehydratase